MDEIKIGDIFTSEIFKTEIVVVKNLGNGKFIVRGKMGEFQIREQLLRSSYKKSSSDPSPAPYKSNKSVFRKRGEDTHD